MGATVMKNVFSNTALDPLSVHSILEAFLAGTNDSFLVLDNNKKIILFNHNAEELIQLHTGKKLNHFDVLQQLFENNPSFNALLKNLEYAFDGGVVKFSLHIPFSNGDKWYDIELNPLKSLNDILGCAIGIFDTTEKHEAQQKIQNSEKLFKALVQNSTDAFLLADEDFRIHYTSDSIQFVLGFTSGQVNGKAGFGLIHEEDTASAAAWFNRLMQNPGKLYPIELRMKNAAGQWVYAEVSGKNLLHDKAVRALVINLRNIQSKKVAHDSLIQTEQRLSLLLNNTKESFIILNSRLRILTYNRAAQEHSPFFFTQQLQSGLSVFELIREDALAEYIEMFEDVFAGNEREKETCFVDAHGNSHIYQHIFRPLKVEDDIQGVFITSGNITQRKMAEAKVRESEERFKTLLQYSFDAIMIVDEHATIQYISPSIKHIFGYDPGEMTGTKGFDYVHEDDLQGLIKSFERTINHSAEEIYDYRMRKKDGAYVWVESKGRAMFANKYVRGILINIRDISERKKAQEEVLLSEQRFKGLVQNGGDMISILDEKGNVMYSSPTVHHVLGIDPQNAVGRNPFNNIHPEDVAYVKSKFDPMLSKHTRQTSVGTFRYADANKNYRWLETVATNLLDDPAVKGIVVNSRDVTERVQMLHEQTALTEELLKHNKDLQQFSFITSHNLRAPVANLISLLSLYNDADASDPFNKVLFEKIRESILQMNDTLNDLINVLVVKSSTNVETEFVKFQDVVLQVHKSVDNLLQEKKGKLSHDFSEAEGVHYNKMHMESIFLNLVSNAIKYSSDERPPQLNLVSYNENDFTVVEFRDNGIGINLERHGDRIFGLYQRFHTNKDGKGLGLYMIKSQITALGGKIEVQSKPGEGATFRVYFKKTSGGKI